MDLSELAEHLYLSILEHNSETYRSLQSSQLCFFLLREQVSKWKMRDIVKEFSLLCRGLRGTEDPTDYWAALLSEHPCFFRRLWDQTWTDKANGEKPHSGLRLPFLQTFSV